MSACAPRLFCNRTLNLSCAAGCLVWHCVCYELIDYQVSGSMGCLPWYLCFTFVGWQLLAAKKYFSDAFSHCCGHLRSERVSLSSMKQNEFVIRSATCSVVWQAQILVASLIVSCRASAPKLRLRLYFNFYLESYSMLPRQCGGSASSCLQRNWLAVAGSNFRG